VHWEMIAQRCPENPGRRAHRVHDRRDRSEYLTPIARG
jgi:hypothetical protein